MFIERGYAETTLLDIAKEAAVATRTLTQHFGDKEDLFRKVMFIGNPDAFEPQEVDETADLRSSLIKGGRHVCGMTMTERSMAQMRLMIAESTRFPEMIGDAATALYRQFLKEISILFRELAARGLIPDADHDESAELFLDLLVGSRMIMTFFGWGNASNKEGEIERRVDLFIGGRFRERTQSR